MIEDSLTRAAVQRAARAGEVAARSWRPDEDDHEATEAAEEAKILAAAALEHLEAERWDEAIAAGEQAAEIDEVHGTGVAWREFALLVEEAAETGRAL